MHTDAQAYTHAHTHTHTRACRHIKHGIITPVYTLSKVNPLFNLTLSEDMSALNINGVSQKYIQFIIQILYNKTV